MTEASHKVFDWDAAKLAFDRWMDAERELLKAHRDLADDLADLFNPDAAALRGRGSNLGDKK